MIKNILFKLNIKNILLKYKKIFAFSIKNKYNFSQKLGGKIAEKDYSLESNSSSPSTKQSSLSSGSTIKGVTLPLNDEQGDLSNENQEINQSSSVKSEDTSLQTQDASLNITTAVSSGANTDFNKSALANSIGNNYDPFIRIGRLNFFCNLFVIVLLIIVLLTQFPQTTTIKKNLFYTNYKDSKYVVLDVESDNFIKSFAAEYVVNRETISPDDTYISSLNWVKSHTYPTKNNLEKWSSDIANINKNFFSVTADKSNYVSRAIDIVNITVKGKTSKGYSVELKITARDSWVFQADVKHTKLLWKTRTVNLFLIPYDLILQSGNDLTPNLVKDFRPLYLVDDYQIEESKQPPVVSVIDGEYRDNNVAEFRVNKNLPWTTPRYFPR